MIWTTRTGQKIPLCDLPPAHLRNIVALVERRLKDAEAEIDAGYSYSGSGEMAQYYACGAADDACQKYGSLRMCLEKLKEEIGRRELA